MSPLSAARWSTWCIAVGVLAGGCAPARLEPPVADAAAVARIRGAVATAAEATAGAATATGTGWASLKGRFTFAGGPGTPRPLAVDKDVEVCTRNGTRKLLDRSLLVDGSTKGLANVVVFARKTSRVKGDVPSEPLVFDQKDCEFLTQVLVARVGQPVDVRNSDSVSHNTNIDGTNFNQLIAVGGSSVYKPAAEFGVPRPVTCNVHPWMKAYALFRKDGYAAVSAADGGFTIADLPAGEPIEFQVWHERATGASGAVVLDRPDLKWTQKGRFVLTLEADDVKDLGTLEVPASAIGG